MHSPQRLLSALAIALAAATLSFAQSNDAVMQEALKPGTPIEENLRVLTDEIGGRVPGTPAFEKAQQWAIAAFKQAGADSVHTEEFTIPQSWTEGDTQVNVVAPVKFHVRAVSRWRGSRPSPPTTGARGRRRHGLGGRVCQGGRHNRRDRSGAQQGARDLGRPVRRILPRTAKSLPARCKGKALLIAFTSSRDYDILYRHINTLEREDGRDPAGRCWHAKTALRIARLIAHGEKVQMSVSLPNKVGPTITSHNVIAEIKGSELPNEVVIFGAHLDSWNLGTGALDNGCNAALVIDSLRAIKAVGRASAADRCASSSSPVRSRACWARSPMCAPIATNWTTSSPKSCSMPATAPSPASPPAGARTSTRRSRPLLQPFAHWKATEITNDAALGTDNYDFMIEGVPTILPNQETANYLINYHATSDTFDKVDFAQLKKNEAITGRARCWSWRTCRSDSDRVSRASRSRRPSRRRISTTR